MSNLKPPYRPGSVGALLNSQDKAARQLVALADPRPTRPPVQLGRDVLAGQRRRRTVPSCLLVAVVVLGAIGWLLAAVLFLYIGGAL